MQSLHRICDTFHQKLRIALKQVPSHLLSLGPRENPEGFPPDVVSPIFPIMTSAPNPLAKFLVGFGYFARPIPYPAVPRGKERIRVIVHARNTEAELDEFIARLLEWASSMQKQEQEEEGVASLSMRGLGLLPMKLPEHIQPVPDEDVVRPLSHTSADLQVECGIPVAVEAA